MKRKESFRQKLNRMINGAARVVIFDETMRAQAEIERIRAKAAVFIENNPQPRAVYLLG